MSIVKTTTDLSRRNPQRGHLRARGSVALSAIVALAVVFTVAIGMLTLGDNVQRGGTRQLRSRGARAMARAGIDYGYWQYTYNGASLPYSITRPLGDGNFTVSVTDDSARVSGTIKLQSTGSLSGVRQIITERILDPMISMKIFDYALCSGRELSVDKLFTITGDIRSNSYISLIHLDSIVDGKAVAGGGITISTLTGRRVPNTAHIPFPPIDMAYYQAIANRKFFVTQIWNGFTFLYPGEVVYVTGGDVILRTGLINGTGTIVTDGQVKFEGDTVYALPGDKLAVLTTKGLDTSLDSKVVGFYYAHSSNNDAQANLSKMLTITSGSIAADQFSLGGSAQTYVHDSDMNQELAYLLHLPGY